jgi:putative hydrolase of the HAD superfamily
MQRPTALFFDLDGTLLDDDAGVERSLALVADEVLSRAMPSLDAQAFTETYQRHSRALWESGDVFVEDINSLRLTIWRQALTSFGSDHEALAVAARDAYARFRLEKPEAFADALPVLSAVHGHYPLGLITNGWRDSQRAKLAHVGLTQFFDVIVTSEEYGSTKPNPGIFEHAAKLLKADLSTSWYIGDSLANDIKGSQAAGMTSVWINRPGRAHDARYAVPHAQIAKLPELLTLLDTATRRLLRPRPDVARLRQRGVRRDGCLRVPRPCAGASAYRCRAAGPALSRNQLGGLGPRGAITGRPR